MKIGLFFAALLLGSNAFAFPVNANCSFNQATGQCAVYNNSSRPIYCNISIRGRVSSGFWFTGQESVTIFPGQFAYAYVYANNPMMDPLVSTNGSANCSF